MDIENRNKEVRADQAFEKELEILQLQKLGRHDLLKVSGRHATTPEHYAKGIEPVKFIQSHDMGFCAGNVIKYVCRYKDKGTPLEDLNKARHYIDLMLKELEE
jgi:hypothetical protein